MQSLRIRNPPILNVIFAVLILATTTRTAAAQFETATPSVTDSAIHYTISLPQPQTQMVEVSMHIPNVNDTETLDVALPTWRPGKYLILDQAGALRNVHALNATTEEPLLIEKVRKSVWQIQTNDATDVTVCYSIYANELSGRTRHVDETHAFLSGESVFLYVNDNKDRPAIITLEAPDDWQVSTGLNMLSDNPRELYAPNYDVLIDSPIEIGIHETLTFTVADIPHEIIIWGEADYDRNHLIEDFTKLTQAQLDMWGSFPYQRYVYMIHVGGGASGGTEHINSTIMQTSVAAMEGSKTRNSSYKRLLSLTSHELFHAWNVKALRPADLVPYDYEQENYTTLLWVAEGTTSYYDDLFLARTKLVSENEYYNRLSSAIGRLRRTPGRKVQSLRESSFDAWIKYNRSSPDDINSEVSFYSKGALVSLLLDMRIRKLSNGQVSLDDVLREMYVNFPLESGGFTTNDLQHTIEQLIDPTSPADLNEFFARYVDGTDDLPLAEAFEVVGLELFFDPADNDQNDGKLRRRPDIGINLRGSTIRSVLSDGPAFEAGLLPGDELLAINDAKISGSIDDAIEAFEPGDVVTVSFFRRDAFRQVEIKLSGRADGEWEIRRMDSPSDEQRAQFESWLHRKWPAPKRDNSDKDSEGTGADDD